MNTLSTNHNTLTSNSSNKQNVGKFSKKIAEEVFKLKQDFNMN